MLTNPEIEVVANDVLIAEYERYAKELDAEEFLDFLRLRIIVINPSIDEIKRCKPYFPENEYADVIHAATCLKADAVLITNDRHFDRIKEAKLIKIWSISDAIDILLGKR